MILLNPVGVVMEYILERIDEDLVMRQMAKARKKATKAVLKISERRLKEIMFDDVVLHLNSR